MDHRWGQHVVNVRVRRVALLIGAVVFAVGMIIMPTESTAEPYLAVESGLKCVSCHMNPSGGGKRNSFGALYARDQLASRVLSKNDASDPWTGEVNRWFAVGGNWRGGYDRVDVPGLGDSSDVDVTRATIYAELRAIPNLLTIYFDEKIAPDDTDNREAYALLTPADGKYTVKIWQFFLPFGLRLQDDRSFVRQSSGINFFTPDNGVELGLELNKWSAQLAVSDGTAGGPNVPNKRQTSLSASYVQPRWRVGASYNINEDDLGDRDMQSVFAGFRTGPISWLAELDYITYESPVGDRDLYASLLEGNWRIRKGQNLKLSYEYFDPDLDADEDELERYSLVWEYSPVQFVQTRVGLRAHNGVPNVASTNRDELFAELHFYF